MKSRIDIIGIGPPKCATTLFAEQIREIENIILPAEKELVFFSSEKRFSKGYDYYHSFFPDFRDEGKYIEISVDYFYDSEKVSKRLEDYSKHLILFCILRHPVDRACSHLLWLSQIRYPNVSLDKVLEKHSEIVGASLYSEHLEVFRKRFQNRISVIDYEYFIARQRCVLQEFLTLIGLDSYVVPQKMKNKKIGATIAPHCRGLESLRVYLFKLLRRHGLSSLISWSRTVGLSGVYRKLNSRPKQLVPSELRSIIESKLRVESNLYQTRKKKFIESGRSVLWLEEYND